ncbi:uncharacterized protein LOC143569574 [Bidens hawaiensis]|uniref:uncharacterized protein LOC143569574 n=1 Tax=Bidens hawaiensis TaxID=980011 RepID=UPI00404B544E
MDSPFMAWLPELEMEDSRQILKHQQAHPRYNNSMDSFSSESFKGYPNLVTGHQSIHLTTNSGDVDKQQDHKATKISHGSSSSTFTISFGNPAPQEKIDQFQLYGRSNLRHQDGLMPKEETIESLNELLGSFNSTAKLRSARRNFRQAQEHVLAERKRREKLAECFISLSALLPGLKELLINR